MARFAQEVSINLPSRHSSGPALLAATHEAAAKLPQMHSTTAPVVNQQHELNLGKWIGSCVHHRSTSACTHMQTPIELTAAFFITRLWETEGLGGSRWPGSLDGFIPVLALFGSLRILPAAFSCCPEVLYATMAILLRIIVLLLTCGFSMEHRRRRAHADAHDVLYGDDNSSNGTLQPVTQWDGQFSGREMLLSTTQVPQTPGPCQLEATPRHRLQLSTQAGTQPAPRELGLAAATLHPPNRTLPFLAHMRELCCGIGYEAAPVTHPRRHGPGLPCRARC